ncbi:MAG TPA: hypothetical protein VMU20_09365 [Candidatus Dormibacteraeota bacterium]|nr:hypothetical protein [Candidatus Dormibacteraeota bacterium]
MPAPGAPVHMVMSSAAQWLFTVVHFAVAVGVTVWVLRHWRGAQARLALLVLIGGGLSVLGEPFFDRLGFIWHAAVGQWTLLVMYGHHIPLWMLPVYYWFIGGQTLLVVQRVRSGAGARDLWRLYALFCAMDFFLELPILYIGGVYTYFGNQPFWSSHWLPLPLWYAPLNGLLPLAAAGAAVLLLSLRGRAHVWSIPVAIPMAIFAVYAATAWPIWAALNSGAGSVVTDICGALAIALGVYTAHLLIAVLRREKTVEVEITAPSVARQLASARR